MTTNATTSFGQRLDAYLGSFQPTPEVLAARRKADEQREEFLRRFPLDSIPNLTLEQYCIGKGDRDNFCWWVERGTKLYNSYFPGSSAAYGVWYSAKPGKNQKWYGNDGPGYGKTSQIQSYLKEHADATEADALREVILKPLHAFLMSRGRDKTSAIRQLMIGNGFILKLLNLYFPEDYIVINSGKWITKILSAIGEDASIDVFEGNRKILQFFDRKKEQFPDSDFTQYDFVAFLEKELNLKEKEPTEEEDQKATTEPSMNQHHSLNTILCGPPGTGKTYNAINYAVAILEGKKVEDVQAEDYHEVRKRYSDYKEQGRIAFTTFHQSYGYEDFIEGIRPVLGDDEGGSLAYELHKGAFNDFCAHARRPTAQSVLEYGLNENPSVWKVSLEGTGENETRKDCLDHGYIRIGWDEYGETISPETFKDSSEGRTILNAFVNGMSIGDVVLSCWSATEIDAIGVVTGDYEWNEHFNKYRRLRKVRWLVTGLRENVLPLNGGKRLTLSTVYRLGRVQVADVLSVVSKHLNRADNPPKFSSTIPFVFIIDEINRGNISKIFGELITLIEPNKRLGADEETKATLPYSGEEFGVPKNVYILGTMNTADRSIALLDTALRRRFNFVEMMPDSGRLADIEVDGTDIDLAKMLQTMNDRIEFLLDREHTIGHAYFMGDFQKNPTLDGLADIFRNKIVPLLQEYFFDDYSKIRLVLGDNAKPKGIQFVQEETNHASLFVGTPIDIDLDKPTYRINLEAFGKAEAYTGIYA